MARYGYARISTRSQRDDAQLDALAEAGCERVWADTASGRLARRPEWDDCLDHLRAGDELVVTRLSRMARSVRHLTDIAAALDQRGIDLVVLKQGIDTTTPAGRFTFHVLAAMDEMLADLISEGTKEGLAAARARGRTGGRPPTLTSRQIGVARAMYEALNEDGKRRYTVDEIAETFHVSRKTIYRQLAAGGQRRQPDKTARPTRTSPPAEVGSSEVGSAPAPTNVTNATYRHQRDRAATLACPSCGHEPATRSEARQQRADLAVLWLHQSTPRGTISEHRHCAACQPHSDCAVFECAHCGDGPILTGALAKQMRDRRPSQPTAALRAWLTQQGWQLAPEPTCPEHAR